MDHTRFLPRVGILLLAGVLFASGCSPRVSVRKVHTDREQGIRYYRPKPYLLVTPVSESTTVTRGKEVAKTVRPSDEFVTLELQYLPDFSEEYAIDIRSGFGKADVQLTLENGWMLTELNQDLDAQVDENLKAAADVIDAVGSVIPTGAQETPGGGGMRVSANNVPLGYYESVLSRTCGRQRLMGWRYVGFAPFNACPTEICGMESVDCRDPWSAAVYGLCFVDGVMTFCRLDELRGRENPTSRSTSESQRDGGSQDPVPLSEEARERLQRKLTEEITREIAQSYRPLPVQLEVRAPKDRGLEFDYIVRVQVPLGELEPAATNALVADIEHRVHAGFPVDHRIRVDVLSGDSISAEFSEPHSTGAESHPGPPPLNEMPWISSEGNHYPN